VLKNVSLSLEQKAQISKRILEVYIRTSGYGKEERLTFTISAIHELGFGGILDIQSLLKELADYLESNSFSTASLTKLIKLLVESNLKGDVDTEVWKRLVTSMLDSLTMLQEIEEVKTLFESSIDFEENDHEALKEAFETYEDHYFEDEWNDDDDPSSLEDLLERFNDTRKRLDILGYYDSDELEEKIERLKSEDEERHQGRSRSYNYNPAAGGASTYMSEDDQIAEMFRNL